MERPRPEDVALGLLAIGGIAYEFLCPNNKTISDHADRLLDTKYRPIIELGMLVTYLHVANKLPNSIDPFEQGLSRIRQRAIRARQNKV